MTFRTWYLHTLHTIKRNRLDIGTAPPSVQASMLALHQHALELEVQRRKAAPQRTRQAGQPVGRMAGREL